MKRELADGTEKWVATFPEKWQIVCHEGEIIYGQRQAIIFVQELAMAHLGFDHRIWAGKKRGSFSKGQLTVKMGFRFSKGKMGFDSKIYIVTKFPIVWCYCNIE